jgi:hypothetical protein
MPTEIYLSTFLCGVKSLIYQTYFNFKFFLNNKPRKKDEHYLVSLVIK